VTSEFIQDKFKWLKPLNNNLRALYWYSRCLCAESVLRICFSYKILRRAQHILHLEEKIKNQAEEITRMREIFEYKNKLLKACNILIACDGPCNKAYMENPYDLDEEIVKLAERNSARLRHWWNRGGQQAFESYKTAR